jgi:predicted nucleotide-binding protein
MLGGEGGGNQEAEVICIVGGIMPAPKPISLSISHAEAEKQLASRIAAGKQFLARTFRGELELNAAEGEHTKWSEYNHHMLRQLFSDSSLADDYERHDAFRGAVDSDWHHNIEAFRDLVAGSITKLESIKERLEVIPEGVSHEASDPVTADSRKVFVVHGHDEDCKQAVARLIDRLGFMAIILYEETSRNQTLIEKYEAHSDVAFAVILLTPDDIGSARSTPGTQKNRARQNVILELGYFLGRLGRDRVCALVKDDLEIPSDYSGVVYVAFDAAGAWQLTLAKEMKGAGLPVDLNRV